MLENLKVSGVCAALTILAGCASTGAIKGTQPQVAAVQTNPSCLASTGSRLPASFNDCAAIGRSYTREDIDRTGVPTLSGALPLIDPIFQR